MKNNSASTWGDGKALRHMVCGCLFLGLMSCAAPPLPVNDESLKGEHYLRYTIRGENAGTYTQAFRSNYLVHSVFRHAGKKATIPFYSHAWVDISFKGITCRMFHLDQPFRTDPDGIKAFMDKHFSPTVEELALDALEPSVRSQIERGQAAVGMSKEEVLLALGYPSHIDSQVQAAYLTREHILERDRWMYRYNEILWATFHTYIFDEDGNLAQRIP